MTKWIYLLIVIVFAVSSCGLSYRQKMQDQALNVPPSDSIKQDRDVTAFTQVNVQGRINLNIHTGYKKPAVLLDGDPRDLAQISTVIRGTTLYVTVMKGYPRYGVVVADVKAQVLNTLIYKGTGVVKGTQLHTRFLDLYLNNQGSTQLAGSIGLQKLAVAGHGITRINGIKAHDIQIRLEDAPKVMLTGFASLSKLDVSGGGWLSLYWIKSNHLTIKARNSTKIQLAGIVNRLEVELWDAARFKGRHLRAQRSFVKTHGKSVAEISSVNHQSSLAMNASDIYYYNIPTTRADFMASNGAVLNMRPWGLFDTEEFNRYNKQFP